MSAENAGKRSRSISVKSLMNRYTFRIVKNGVRRKSSSLIRIFSDIEILRLRLRRRLWLIRHYWWWISSCIWNSKYCFFIFLHDFSSEILEEGDEFDVRLIEFDCESKLRFESGVLYLWWWWLWNFDELGFRKEGNVVVLCQFNYELSAPAVRWSLSSISFTTWLYGYTSICCKFLERLCKHFWNIVISSFHYSWYNSTNTIGKMF